MPDEPSPPAEAAQPTGADDPGAVEIPLPPPPDAAAHCPWCSAVLGDATAPTCPACGAHLVEDQPVDIPGVTSVPLEILALAALQKTPKLSLGALLTGDDAPEIPHPTKEELPALAPPDAKVRREMRRLELEALGYVIAPDAPADETPPDEAAAEPGVGEDSAGPAPEMPA